MVFSGEYIHGEIGRRDFLNGSSDLRYPGDEARGDEPFGKLDTGKKLEDFVASTLWLKSRADCTGKIGVIGRGKAIVL